MQKLYETHDQNSQIPLFAVDPLEPTQGLLGVPVPPPQIIMLSKYFKEVNCQNILAFPEQMNLPGHVGYSSITK